jgi:hypothetical protein
MTTTKTLQRALGILFRSVTLAADVFRDATSNDEVDAQYIVHGTAKAWANLDGTGTIALRDSLNVSSVVDNGVGTIRLTTPMRWLAQITMFLQLAAMEVFVVGVIYVPTRPYGELVAAVSVAVFSQNAGTTNTFDASFVYSSSTETSHDLVSPSMGPPARLQK